MKDTLSTFGDLSENQMAWLVAGVTNAAVKSDAYKGFYLQGDYHRDIERGLEFVPAPWELVSPMALGRMVVSVGGTAARGMAGIGTEILNLGARGMAGAGRFVGEGITSGFERSAMIAGQQSGFSLNNQITKLLFPNPRMYIVPPGPSATNGALINKGGSLLNADQAIIDPRKLTDYALNPSHPVGGNKARVFDSALGFNQSNANELLVQLRQGGDYYTSYCWKS